MRETLLAISKASWFFPAVNIFVVFALALALFSILFFFLGRNIQSPVPGRISIACSIVSIAGLACILFLMGYPLVGGLSTL